MFCPHILPASSRGKSPRYHRNRRQRDRRGIAWPLQPQSRRHRACLRSADLSARQSPLDKRRIRRHRDVDRRDPAAGAAAETGAQRRDGGRSRRDPSGENRQRKRAAPRLDGRRHPAQRSERNPHAQARDRTALLDARDVYQGADERIPHFRCRPGGHGQDLSGRRGGRVDVSGEEGRADRALASRRRSGRTAGLPARRHEREDRPLSAPALRRAARHAAGRHGAKFLEQGTIEVAPLAFMRGRTLSNAYVVLDEAQNCTTCR